MKFKLASSKVTGVPDQSGWVQIHDFTPLQEEAFKSKGRLVAVISMLAKNDTTLPAKEDLIVGREILTRLHEEYFNRQGNPFDLLSSAVEKIAKDFSSPNESLQILVAIVLEGQIMLSAVGQVEAWIKRGDNLARLLTKGDKISALAGPLEDKDIFFLGTTAFFAKVTPEALKSYKDLETLAGLTSSEGLVVLKLERILENKVPQLTIQTPPPLNSSPEPRIVNPTSISPLRVFTAHLIDKILLHLPSENRKLYIKDELVNPPTNKKRKVMTTTGLILLVLLVVSIFFGIRQKDTLTSKAKYQGILTSVEHNLEEAQNLKLVDQARARDLILTAKSEIDALQAQGIKDSEITALAQRVSENLGGIAGIYEQASSLYLDLGLITSNFKGDDIAASEGRMVVLDRQNKRLESIEIGSSKAEPVAGPDIMPGAKSVAAYSNRNFVSSDDGIWQIGNKAEVVIPKDDAIGENTLISAYAGNFYILDKNNGIVWRYQGDGGTFAPKANWFGLGIKPNLESVVSWTFDGNIWMLTTSGQILRFSGGSPVDFTLKNTNKEIKPQDIFTTQDSKYLYLLDRQNSQILVIDKEGNYKAQYIGEAIKNTAKIVVSEKDQKIILLQSDKLYSLDIKHL